MMIEEAIEKTHDRTTDDPISRRAAIDAVEHITSSMSVCVNTDECHGMKRMQRRAVIELANLPSAQPERDIPIKPIEAIDSSWGIPIRQAVCPECDYYLGRVAFLCDYKGKRITYCETCGQAIDWEGWDFDE